MFHFIPTYGMFIFHALMTLLGSHCEWETCNRMASDDMNNCFLQHFSYTLPWGSLVP